MKKFLLVIGILGFIFLNNSFAHATFLSAGDQIRFGNGDYGHYVEGFGTAGEFKWTSNKGFSWTSFCVELSEYVSPNRDYTVVGLTDYADRGGRGGQDLDLNNDGTLDADSLDNRTAWLFWNFTKGTLVNYNKTDTRFEDEKDLQALIWFFEGEMTQTEFENYAATHSEYILNAGGWLELAENAIADGWENNDVVKIVNLGPGIQDQLIVSPVPEPATMLLFGIGLIGLAGFGRRQTKR